MSHHPLHRALLLALLAAPLGACQQAATPITAAANAAEPVPATAAPAAAPPASAVQPGDVVLGAPKGSASLDWYRGKVDEAFATAKAQNKPIFMYWGAEWCPYCAQLEAEVFSDARFQERAGQFVALYVDGDDEGLVKLFERYGVTGYPTTIVLASDGTELGRLPAGYLKAEPYLESLDALLKAGRPLELILQDALAGKPLGAAEWSALSRAPQLFEQDAGELRARLAEACPPEHAAASRRFKLVALFPAAEALWPKYGAVLQQVLADPALVREQQQLLLKPQVIATAPAGERARLQESWQAALFALASDPAVGGRTRMLALGEAVGLAKLASPTLPADVVSRARALVTSFDRDTRAPLERQAAIGVAASVLVKLGDQAAAEAMVEADLPNSRSPYHGMVRLADWAAERGDVAAELRWARRSYEDALTSHKPRVRQRSTADYLARVVKKAPERRDEVVELAGKLLDLAAASAADLTPKRMDRLAQVFAPVVAWSQQHDPSALAGLQPRLDALCTAVGEASRQACANLLSPAPAKQAS
jgi:thiol-disulfide isomerase/thioredoxin